MALNSELPVEAVGATARLAIRRPGACTYHDVILMLCFLLPMCEDVCRYLLPYSRLLLVQGLALILQDI